MSYVIYCTKKLPDRIEPSTTVLDGGSGTLFGSWYATVLFALEQTLLPVLILLSLVAIQLRVKA